MRAERGGRQCQKPVGRRPLLRAALSAGAAGGVIISILLFAARLPPNITGYDPLSTNAAASLARPSAAHWLGCDFMGRDLFSRIVYGLGSH